jgi:hypothetical protein
VCIVRYILLNVHISKRLRRTTGPYGSEWEQSGDLQAVGDDYWGGVGVMVYLGIVLLDPSGFLY